MYINVDTIKKKKNSQFSIKQNTENILNHVAAGFYRRHDKIETFFLTRSIIYGVGIKVIYML